MASDTEAIQEREQKNRGQLNISKMIVVRTFKKLFAIADLQSNAPAAVLQNISMGFQLI